MSTARPVRLKRLELSNFRGFDELAIDFEDDLTVLVGANGSGKTSVVDAIVCIVRRSGFRLTDVRHGATGAVVGLATDTGQDTVVNVSFQPDGSGRVTSRGQCNLPSIFVYRVNRQVRDLTRTVEAKAWTPNKATEHWEDASAAYSEFFHWFKDMEDLENEQMRYDGGEQNASLAAVRRAVTTLLPEFEEIRVRRQMRPLAMTPVLMLRKGKVELPFDALSEGERTTIAMVGDIARRLALLDEHEDPLQTAATVIIDEIEQHAHPGWQRQILKRLRNTFPNVQLITTTHSPIIVSEVESRQLRVLKDSALIPAEHGPGRDANAVLEDVFDVAPRNEEVQKRLDALGDAIEDDRFDEADALLAELDELVPGGADPDIVYHRNLLALLRAR